MKRETIAPPCGVTGANRTIVRRARKRSFECKIGIFQITILMSVMLFMPSMFFFVCPLRCVSFSSSPTLSSFLNACNGGYDDGIDDISEEKFIDNKTYPKNDDCGNMRGEKDKNAGSSLQISIKCR